MARSPSGVRVPVCAGIWLACAGCGSLAGADYRGEVLFSFTGQVGIDPELTFEHPIGVTLMWSSGGAVEQSAVVTRTEFPSTYTLEVYRPPTGTLSTPWGERWLEVAVGQPVLFEDRDEDDRWDVALEPLVGGSIDQAVLFVDTVRGAGPLSGWTPARSGYHRVELLREPCLDAAVPGLPLAPAAGARTDLQVGVYWPSLLDLDCDGAPDWAGEGGEVFGTCTEVDVYGTVCDLVDQLPPETSSDWSMVLSLMASEPCTATYCGAVVSEVVQEGLPQLACDLPEQVCDVVRVFADEPSVRPSLERAIASGDVRSCLSEVCPALVDSLSR